MKVYQVGGSVRDLILNRPAHDRDYVVVGATAEEMLARGFLRVGHEFPVFLHPRSKEEYALARKEIKHEDGSIELVFTPEVTLAEDMPRFDELPKDEKFGELYRSYCLRRLQGI